MKKICLLILSSLIMSLGAEAQEFYKIKTLKMGFQNSAMSLFTCDDITAYYIILEKDNYGNMYVTFFQPPIHTQTYLMTDKKVQISGGATYRARRVSPHGPVWTKISISRKKNKIVLIEEDAADRWDGKIFFIHTAKKINRNSDVRLKLYNSDYIGLNISD